ncbi:hypothetical protein F7725_012018%2C partial, partial [Scomber scombrus]
QLTRYSLYKVEDDVEIVDAPSTHKSVVWSHFGFLAKRQEDGDKFVDRTKTICKLCRYSMAYTAASTTNMTYHLRRYQKDKLTLPQPPKKQLPKDQTTLQKSFTVPLLASSRRAKEITGFFIACDMRPFSVVDDEGFRKILLSPLKTATKVLSDEKNLTVSPLIHMIRQSMAPDEDDSTTVAAMKKAILHKLEDRYNGDVYEYLLESAALDPRFKALPHVAEDQRETVFERLKERAQLQLQQNQGQSEPPGFGHHVCSNGSDVLAPFDVTLNGKLTVYSNAKKAAINSGINLRGAGLCFKLFYVNPDTDF